MLGIRDRPELNYKINSLGGKRIKLEDKFLREEKKLLNFFTSNSTIVPFE
jgi:hypothetical protein